MNSRLAALDTEWGVRILWWVIGVLLFLAVATFVAVGANGPEDPELTQRRGANSSGSGERGLLAFDDIAFTIAPAGAPAVGFCALHAESPVQHTTGMMFRRQPDGRDAMVFTFERDSTIGFWNRNVPIPLTVAWFDADGDFISSADLEPCGDRSDCPNIYSPRPFRYVIEVPRGGLARLGVRPGARLTLGQDC